MICALTAAGIARQRHELDLAAKAVDFLDEMFKENVNKLEPAQIEQVLKTEKAETKFPVSGGGPTYPELRGQWCDCPSCRQATRGESVSSLDEEEEYDEDNPFEGIDFELPPGIQLPEGLPPDIAKLLLPIILDGVARNETPEQTAARIEREMGLGLPRAKRGKKWR